MDQNLRSYLFVRNVYAYLTMLMSAIYALSLAYFTYRFIVAVIDIPYVGLITLAPLVIFAWELVKALNGYYSEQQTFEEDYLLANTQLARVHGLTNPILNKCNLNVPIKFTHTSPGEDTGAIDLHFSAHIQLDDEMLERPDVELQAILAHEIVHIVSRDSLKSCYLNIVKILVVFYSAIALPFLLLVLPQIPWYFLILSSILIIRFFTSWTEKVVEITADTAATMMGYGNGLKGFFFNYHHKQKFLVWLLDHHETLPKRAKRVSRIMNRLN